MTDVQQSLVVSDGAAPLAAAREENSQIMRMLETAAATPGGAETLERLVALKHKIDDRNASLEFAAALREFQRSMLPIPKASRVNYQPRNGGRPVVYDYADLEDIQNAIEEPLYHRGFSYTFDSEVGAGGMLTVIGTLSHVNGHRVTSRCTVPTSSSSAMSDQQRFGAATTYAKRQVLVSMLGLKLADPGYPGEESSPQKIGDEAAANLQAKIEEVGADKAKFLAWLNVEKIEDIREVDLAKALAELERKRHANAARGAKR